MSTPIYNVIAGASDLRSHTREFNRFRFAGARFIASALCVLWCMTERMTHEEYVAMQRRRVAELARQILAGEIDVLDGACKIKALRFEVEVEDWDQDFIPFVLVESETDHLPIGIEALNWSDEALVRKEPELKHAREWALETVSAACASLVTRFADA